MGPWAVSYTHLLYNSLYNQNVQITRVPSPIYNMINGGKHGTKNLDFQEFHLVPSTSKSFSTTLEFAVSAYSGLKNLFTQRNADVSVSEEGGFTPNLFTNTEAFDIIKDCLLYTSMLGFLGSDPIDKIGKAFETKYGKPLLHYLELN